METEVRKLRATLARRKGGRGRPFAPELRRQISAVGRRLRVASSGQALLASAKMRSEPALAQETPKQLPQSGVRRQLLLPELDAQVTLDSCRETALSYPHWEWPFVRGLFELRHPEKITTCRPLPDFSTAHVRAERPFRVCYGKRGRSK